MAMASYWTQEFLDEMIESLELSLGRVTIEQLGVNTEEAAHWEQTQAWLEYARRVRAQPHGEDAYTRLPPFPLTGAQLRALQSAVDHAVQVQRTHQLSDAFFAVESLKALDTPPLTSHGRLGLSLNRVQISSLALAAFLALTLGINVAELLILHNLGLRAILGTNVTLSVLAIGAWGIHHYHILEHVHLFHSVHPHLQKIPALAGLLHVFRP